MSDLDRTDDRLIRVLQALFRHELRRAELNESRPANEQNNTRQMTAGPLAIFVAVIVILIGIALRPTIDRQLAGATPSPEQSMSGVVVTAAPTATPLITAEATPLPATPGPLVDGVPESFGGQPVLRGKALADMIAGASSDEPFLAGGWFHKGEVIRFCSYRRFDPAVDPCYSFGLYAKASGGDPVWVGRGDEGLLPTGLSEEANRAVVLLIHTHDPRCSSDDKGCTTRPVLTQIVWLGTPS